VGRGPVEKMKRRNVEKIKMGKNGGQIGVYIQEQAINPITNRNGDHVVGF
jgi:hypothetical protein